MATLIPETGDGLANANSYASIDSLDTVLSDLGGADDWLSCRDSTSKEQAAIRACEILEQFLARRMHGVETTVTQSLCVPRVGLYDRRGRTIASDSVPAQLVMAQAITAAAIRRGEAGVGQSVAATRSLSMGRSSVAYAGTSTDHVRRGIPIDALRCIDGLYDPLLRVVR